MSPYRERFGFKGGEFPVAEAVSERSLALPFFTAMTEDQVERVCAALAAALQAKD
jgi:perosamine synthetase